MSEAFSGTGVCTFVTNVLGENALIVGPHALAEEQQTDARHRVDVGEHAGIAARGSEPIRATGPRCHANARPSSRTADAALPRACCSRRAESILCVSEHRRQVLVEDRGQRIGQPVQAAIGIEERRARLILQCTRVRLHGS